MYLLSKILPIYLAVFLCIYLSITMFESVVWRQLKSLMINNWNTELREFEHLNSSSYNTWNFVLPWQGAQKTLMVQTAKRRVSARMGVNVKAHSAPVPVLLALLEQTAVKVSDLCLVFQLASLCSLHWLWTCGCPTAFTLYLWKRWDSYSSVQRVPQNTKA